MKKIIGTILFSGCVLLVPNSILAKETNTEMFTGKDTGTTGNVIQKFEADNGDLKETLKLEMAKATKKYNADSAVAILESPAGIEFYKYEIETDEVDLAKKYSSIAVILTNSNENKVIKFESLNGDITFEEVQKYLISGLEKK
ncbi:hypothetical protein ACQKNC_15940 [Lysinibacillus sp. NPDC094177]|uniref:hypothetical protein n=1 Tax=Lysinibacillus sp. NPDC094177 TaxID=3390580 RepID=UPI003D089BCC